MEKISYYLDFIKEPVRSEAIANAKEYGNYEDCMPTADVDKPIFSSIQAPTDRQSIAYLVWSALLGAFHLMQSREGLDYWWHILDNIEEYIDADKLPKSN